MYTIQDLIKDHENHLGLKLVLGQEGLGKQILRPEVQRPGLSLTGFMKKYIPSLSSCFWHHGSSFFERTFFFFAR